MEVTFKDITDNKKFWKTLKLLVSDKGTCASSKIILVVDDESLSDDKESAETFNNCFNNAVKSLNLQCDPEHLNDASDENDLIEIAIKSLKIILALWISIKISQRLQLLVLMKLRLIQ